MADRRDPNAQLPEAAIEAETEATAHLGAAAMEVPPELLAQTLVQYFRAWFTRVRSGDAGVLPVIAALALVFAYFQAVVPEGLYLQPENLVNLFKQGAVFMVLAMAEGFVLLLGEIDLSAGYVAAIGGTVAAELVQPVWGWPWWAAIVAALALCGTIGLVQGQIITRLRLPSFVVTLAGFLLWNGVLIVLLGKAGGVGVTSPTSNDQKMIYGIVWNNVEPFTGWIVMAVIVSLLGATMWLRDAGRRRGGLVAPPPGLTYLKIAFVAAAGIAVVAISNVNRGRFLPIEGVPWVVLLVLGILAVWTVLLERTPFGRHVYAVGGNAEAARRAGINVGAVRTMGFVLCSFTAGFAGIIYASQQAGMTTNIQGGQLVLYAVGAAVIGGTSLYGGRGRVIHGVLGGLVIAAIYNGLFMLGYEVQVQYIVTGLVLLAAVTIDAVSRRGATGGAAA